MHLQSIYKAWTFGVWQTCGGNSGRCLRGSAPLVSVVLCFLLLAAPHFSGRAAQGIKAGLRTQPDASLAAFTASRHPDTTDGRGPYRVRIRQLTGPAIAGGQVSYLARKPQTRTAISGAVKLRRLEGEEAWTAEIPGQPIGSTITYHYLLFTRNGQLFRHPARAPSVYQFRIVALQVLSVAFPKDGGGAADGDSIKLRVRAASRPIGEMVVRFLPSSSDAPNERQIPLLIAKEQDRSGEHDVYVMEGNAPKLEPGQIADFYFQLRAAYLQARSTKDVELKIPADAPARVYSIKRSIASLQSLPGDGAFVLGAGFLSRQRWVGLKGGGVWAGETDGEAKHWGIGDGLPSGVARFVLPDSVSGRVFIGTDRGVVEIEPEGDSMAPLIAPSPAGRTAELPALIRLGSERRAGPGAISTLDGTLLFQLQAERLLEQRFPVTVFLQLQDDKLNEWKPPLWKFPLVGMSCLTFDAVDGCWLIGGFVSDGNSGLRPVVARRCGELVEQISPADFTAGDFRATPQRIIALTRDPSTGALLVGLELALANNRQRRIDYGIYRIEGASGDLSPLTTETATLGVELTSLATDWAHDRVLAGTFGKGLLQIQSGVARHLNSADKLPSEITTIKVDEESGVIMVGTSRGAFDLTGEEARSLPFGPRGEAPLLTDALPMDTNRATGRVLLSSYSAGLFQLEREKTGHWRIVESLRPGKELPKGLFGDAQYTQTGGLSAILYSQGLLRIENGQSTLLGPADGLFSGSLLRLLARRSGDIWLAYSPQPFGAKAGAAIQILQGNRVARTVEIASREIATIGRWIEVPERNSAFAATPAGVVEVREDGMMTRLSTDAVSAIVRNAQTGMIGVVGTVIQRWDSQRFVPMLFRVDHPRSPTGQFYPGSPIDIAIDKAGIWYLLFNNGILALLNRDGGFLATLDAEDGIPVTARRLLAHLETGDIFIGSNSEGLIAIRFMARN